MKKLLIAGGIASALVMTGCASTTNDTAATPAKPHQIDAHHKHHKGQMPKDERGGLFQAFQCENNAVVHVHYLPEQDKAKVHINAPSWNLNNAHVDMTAAVAASGQRFVNETNPNAKLEWHSKGAIGALSVTNAQNQTTSLSCDEVEFKHPPMPPKGKPAQAVQPAK